MDDEDLDLSAQLSAWTAPPAPLNLADRVIARATATDEAIAVVTQRRRAERRWWIGGALAAVIVGAAIAVFIVPRDTAPDEDAAISGMLATVRPQQLALPGAIATLGPGTVVSWQTSDGAVHVQHHSGAVTWRIGDRPLSVDVGAAVASIEASNATLRVETHMNLTDARLITTAAVTSAAVAFITVAVYEGHVKLSSAGQTVVVAPGSTYEVRPGQPPVVELNIAGTPPVAPPPVVALSPVDELVVPIGESITIHNAGASVRIRVDTKCSTDTTPFYPSAGAVGPGDYNFSFTCDGIDKHGRIRVVHDVTINGLYSPAEGDVWGDTVTVEGMPVARRQQVTIEGVPVQTTSTPSWRALVKPPVGRTFVAVRIDGGVDDINYYIRHAAGSARTTPRPVNDHAAPPAEFDGVLKPIAPTLGPCVQKFPGGQDVAVSVAADGHVTDILTSDSDPKTDACLRKVLRSAVFPKAKAATRNTYHVDPVCNADDLQNAGIAATARGDNDVALQEYDASLSCKFDMHSLALAFMSACRANKVDFARKYWKRMNADQKTHYLQMCVHEHITQQQLDE